MKISWKGISFLILEIVFSLLGYSTVRSNDNTYLFIISSLLIIGITIIYILKCQKVTISKDLVICNVLFVLYNFILIYKGNVLFPDKSMLALRNLIIMYLVGYFLYNYLKLFGNIDVIFDVIIFSTLFMTIIVILFALLRGGFNTFGSSAGFNSNDIAMMCSFSTAFAYSRYKESSENRYIAFISFFILIVVLSGCRKALASVMICIFFINVLADRKFKLLKVLGLIPIMFLILYAFLKVPILYSTIGYRIEGILMYFQTGTSTDASFLSRMALIETALPMIKRNIWTGYGLNSFRYWDYHRGLYSHNNYIELLFSGGIIGLVLYYILPISLLIKVYKKYCINNSITMSTLLSVLISLMFMDIGLVSYSSRYVIVLLIIIAVCMNMYDLKDDKRSGVK